MKTLRIGFSKPKSPWAIGSVVIQKLDGANFSHAFLRWTSATIERDLIYQASHGMVHFISGDNFDADEITVVAYSIDLTDAQWTEMLQKCIDLAATKYGTLELFGMGLEKYTGIKNPFRDGSRTFVCSELVGTILKMVSPIELDLELAGPGQLERLISSLPAFKRIA